MVNSAAIMMSRLKRLVYPDENWLAGLRGVIRRIAADQAKLLMADGTAGTDIVRCAATRFQIPSESVSDASDSAKSGSGTLPDQFLINAAEVVYVLHLRAGGNLGRLLDERLRQGRSGVVLVDLPHLQPTALRDELCRKGAVLWQPTEEQLRPFEPRTQPAVAGDPFSDHSGDAQELPAVYTLCPFPPADEWDFLTHTTRACPGPWPGETQEDYFESLLEARPDADHSALSSLMRIVSQKKLIASGRTIREGCKVVSFTSLPLSALPPLRRFRPHRIHWDFEPYGVCLRREWLQRRGAQPVHYADENGWARLSDQERPFFQRAIGDSGIDWTIEKEWRVVGDLSLCDATPADVILFVPNFEAAKSLARVTPWPITLWPQELPAV